DERLHPACITLTFATAFRRALANLSPEDLEARLDSPDPELRARQRLAVAHGLDAPHLPGAVSAWASVFDDMDAALAGAEFLAGASYSLADAALTPYLLRAQMLGLAALWEGRRPNLARWFEHVRARESFDAALTRVMTDADRQRLTVAPDDIWPRVRE